MTTPLHHFDFFRLPRFPTAIPTSATGGGFTHFHSVFFSSSARTRFSSSWSCSARKNKRIGVSVKATTLAAWRIGCESIQGVENSGDGENNAIQMYGSDEEGSSKIPTQIGTIVRGSESGTGSKDVLVSEYKPMPDVDYLQELLAIQQQGPRAIGFFGTRNMGFMHQELIEILSYALVITKNHIFTSGASGTNAAVIRGALRAEKPELLTVILPQSLKKQPPESQELLSKVQNVIEKPHNDHLPLIEASRLCNMDIISEVQQVICFAFHDSRLLMETCQEAKNMRKIVTLFYLD
ncbi:cysteine sulfinate desulfinase/cysteinedesulfurase and related enzymes [Striga asiatica]|uniref:Cysteine sulfinate desulfinase/cysteinedesulfurase and related enzymes n=1 Tax=Striga asiatica TaxID=4170 RepID=A0A5A7P576_STRAF|nr:cysteine sulfinate desulfinase/cysteinedesulfurase and related enzymes [Striga asiatica]